MSEIEAGLLLAGGIAQHNYLNLAECLRKLPCDDRFHREVFNKARYVRDRLRGNW
jgi:hypothetical protein